ncbi:MAG: DNA-directed RNA polymerase subunit H [Acidilobaceae archaeon]|nr:DNA-directed RNA polymerase subunit H [Acidilobaceae archaeon]MCX8165639.1 DNA-directed RNA polymerase subunit H [Acidilobaceae archaeon]MDW7974065.1 DNA-directed RNA polymerase subunit H [Sulfolobales archaeon]
MSAKKPGRKILEHRLVPEHRKLSVEEAVKVFKSLGVKPWQLPQISVNDPIVRLLNAKPGDVIEIKRRSPTGGTSLAYRIVVAFERRA